MSCATEMQEHRNITWGNDADDVELAYQQLHRGPRMTLSLQ